MDYFEELSTVPRKAGQLALISHALNVLISPLRLLGEANKSVTRIA